MTLKENFTKAVRDSVVKKEGVKSIKHIIDAEVIRDYFYYENDYAEPIKKYFKCRNIKSFEALCKKNNLTRICSLASSARLCFIDFMSQKESGEIEFEKSMSNDISSITKFDAAVGNVYYECKCQEIINRGYEVLKSSYLNSALFNEFEVKDIDVREKRYEKTNKVISYLIFSLNSIGIKLDGNYNSTRFSVKQLICHLIALANNNYGVQKTLQYIIYKPSLEYIEDDKKLKKVYETFEKEVAAIWDSKNIKKFISNHNILLPKPIYKYIDEIDDPVLKKIF